LNTYAIQIELHFQSERTDDDRFDAFVAEVRSLAAKHGIDFGDYQSFQLRAADYRIAGCASCGHLTVDRAHIHPGIENMLPDFWFFVRRGSPVEGLLMCDSCRPRSIATRTDV
jgi:hypothetical protein